MPGRRWWKMAAAMYDAISYYFDHRAEIEAQIAENKIEQALEKNNATMKAEGVILLWG